MKGSGNGDLDSLDLVVLAGEKSGEALITESNNRYPGLRLVNEYGPTETTVGATANLEFSSAGTAVIGRPVSNTAVYILDGSGLYQPVGVPGELVIGGVGVARGYLNNPELTVEKFCNGLYHTGDLAKWQPDGNIVFLGRIDQQVKIRGFRIEPGEIENRLRQSGGVSDAVVTTRRGGGGELFLCAYVVTDAESDPDGPVSGLKEELGRHLPEYMVPEFISIGPGYPADSLGQTGYQSPSRSPEQSCRG